MQNHAAVFRDGVTLKEGCQLMDGIFQEQKDLKVNQNKTLLFSKN
jgi:hypothetical protein